MLGRSTEFGQRATNKKGWTRCHPRFAHREGFREEVPPSRVDLTANAKKGKVECPPCPLRPSDIQFWRRRRSSDSAAYYRSIFSRSVNAFFCRLRRNSISSSPEWKRRDFPESTSSIRPSSSLWLCSPWLPRHTTKAPCMTKFSLRQVQKYSVKKPWSSREICETQLNRQSSF